MAQVQVRISAECAARLDAMIPRCLTVLRRRTRGELIEFLSLVDLNDQRAAEILLEAATRTARSEA